MREKEREERKRERERREKREREREREREKERKRESTKKLFLYQTTHSKMSLSFFLPFPMRTFFPIKAAKKVFLFFGYRISRLV